MTHHPPRRTELAEALYSFKKPVASLWLFSFFINLLALTPSVYMLQVYDRVLASRNEVTLLMLTLIMVGLYILLNVLEWVRSRVLVRISAKMDVALSARVFTASFERNLRRAGGSPAQAMGDLSNLRQFITGNGLFAFFDAPWAPIYLAVIFLFHPMLGVIATLGAITLLLLAYANERVSKQPLADANVYGMAANLFATNNLRNAEVIEAMGMLSNVRKRWFERQEKMLALQELASDKSAAVSTVTKFVRITLQSVVLGAGALLAIENKITPGMMIAGSIIVGRALSPVELAIGSWKGFLAARDAYRRLEELLKTFPARDTGMSLPSPKGHVRVENATAIPPGSQTVVLRGLNFEMIPGEVVGIVGPSASGKSTLARLLVGVWPAQAGKIRLDGADIYQWNKEELGPSIGYLPQDIELFDGTLAENIARFGNVDSDLVIAAAMRAGVHEMILRLPKGYDTQIGESGGILSGGQRQRVGLARALYGDPALIVLDEPNSNLDDVGEHALVRAVLELKQRGKTVAVISHRMNIIGVVDKLMVLRDGALQMIGARDAVLQEIVRLNQAAAAAQQPA
jgi:ATP-binding cassette subfamily C exporter for protease/lipase